MNKEELYIKCDCVGECSVMKVTKVLFDGDGNDKNFDVNFVIYSSKKNKFPLAHKLKHIWNIVRFGEPYDDQIVISKEDTIKLTEFLNQLNK